MSAYFNSAPFYLTGHGTLPRIEDELDERTVQSGRSLGEAAVLFLVLHKIGHAEWKRSMPPPEPRFKNASGDRRRREQRRSPEGAFLRPRGLTRRPSEAQAPFIRVTLIFFNLQNWANGLIRAGTHPSAISRLEALARWAEEDVRMPFPTNAEQRSLIRAGIEAVRRVGVRDEAERRSEDAASLESLIARRQAMETAFDLADDDPPINDGLRR